MKMIVRVSFLLLPIVAFAQSAGPSFDVVSIKRNVSGSQDIGINQRSVSTFDSTNVPLSGVIMRAYQVKNIAGAPDWVSADRYDIVAKAPGRPGRDEVSAMLRTMFRERLKLAAHIEPREMSVFVIEVERPDHPGLKRVTADCAAIAARRDPAAKADNGAPLCGYTWAGGAITAGGITMQAFAGLLDYVVERVVVDRTGLPGPYAFNFRFSLPGIQAAGADDRADFFTAIREQLGLKLTPARAPVDTVVIDHVERPEEN